MDNRKITPTRKSVGRFARMLLVTTCLTVASSGAALANTIYTEGTDFPSTGPGTSMAAATNPGTTIVNGSGLGGDSLDFFELTGLGAGLFTVTAHTGDPGFFGVSVFNDANLTTPLETSSFGFGSDLNFGALAIPGNGNLVFRISSFEGGGSYAVTVNTTNPTAVPEPSSASLAGLALAGALALGRKRKQ